MVKKYFSIFFYCVRGKARERFCDPLLSGNSVNFWIWSATQFPMSIVDLKFAGFVNQIISNSNQHGH